MNDLDRLKEMAGINEASEDIVYQAMMTAEEIARLLEDPDNNMPNEVAEKASFMLQKVKDLIWRYVE